MDKVAEIRRAWELAGKPACKHERGEKEYELGAQTGDIACLDCGQTWWQTKWALMQQESEG
jgi:hypothetical protein